MAKHQLSKLFTSQQTELLAGMVVLLSHDYIPTDHIHAL